MHQQQQRPEKSVGSLVDTFQTQKVSTQNVSTQYEKPIQARIEKLFVVLGSMFNEKFTSRFPTAEERKTGKLTWTQTLSDVSDDEISLGLEACKHWRERFAPTLIEFRKLCVEKRKPKQIEYYEPIGDPGSETRRLVNEGNEASRMLKKLMCSSEPWSKVMNKIARELTILKQSVRNINPRFTDLENIIEVKRMIKEDLDYELQKRAA